MANIKNVAQRAGVSVATVSNYLNKTKPVSRATAAKISEAIDALQYTQNQSAKALKSNFYRDVGVILPNLNDSYYVQLYQGIESVFHNSDYYLNLCLSYDIPEMEMKAARDMLSKQVSGLIVVTCQPDNWKFYYENFTKNNRSLVLIDRAIHNLDASTVCFDNRTILEAITRYLLQTNYNAIYLMAGPSSFSCEAECIDGFCTAYLDERAMDAGTFVVPIELNKEDAFRKTTRLLNETVPDVILTTSELTATGIVEALQLLGYSSGEIPVITLGEEHWNRFTHTFAEFSAARPAIKMGTEAARMLIDKMCLPQIQENDHILMKADCAGAIQKLEERLRPCITSHIGQIQKKIRVLMLDTPAVHAFGRLIKNFENNTGIRVEVNFQPHNEIFEEINRSHDGPEEQRYDVYMYDIPWLPMLASGGVLSDLTGKLQDLDVQAFLLGTMENYSHYGSGYYGVPLVYAPQMLYYRKNIFEDFTLRTKFEKLYGTPLKPPRTFTEFDTIAKFFTTQTDIIPYGISIPAAYPECLAPELYMRLRAYGSEVVDNQGNVVINNPRSLRAYINLVRSVKSAKPDYMQSTDVSVVEDFLKGETAMLITYPGFLTDVSDLRKNSRIGSIGCAYIPGRSPLLGGWGLGIDSNSTCTEDAFAFLKWACNEEMSNYFSMLGGYSAVTAAYTNDELVNLYPWLPLYESINTYCQPMLPSVSTRGRVISPNDIDDIVCKWLYKLLRGEIEIEEVLLQTQFELERLIKRPVFRKEWHEESFGGNP